MESDPPMNPKLIDDLVTRLSDTLPAGVKTLQKDIENNFRATLQAAFNHLDLVTREEFDAQCKVLARLSATVQELEQRVAALEQAAAADNPPPPDPTLPGN